MGKIKELFFKVVRVLYFTMKSRYERLLSAAIKLGHRGCHSQVGQPSVITRPQLVFMHDYARLSGCHIILNNKGRFIMGKYSVASKGLNVVPDMHTSTVGIPQCCLGASHVHDKVMDVIVEEDVWIGMNVTLLGGSHVKRGCIIGANSLINKNTIIPPYSVVAGIPARIIAVKFSIEQIMRHERRLYAPEERFSQEELEELFCTYYQGKKVFGVDEKLTDSEHQMLERTMKKLGFKYPTFNEDDV